MHFFNRYLLLYSLIVLLSTALFYYLVPGFGSSVTGLLIGYMAIITIAALLINRQDPYSGYFGFNYHLITYVICIGLPLLLKAMGKIQIEGIRDMAISWGIGLTAHLLIVLFVFRKKRLGSYDKSEIFN